ncbi:uncharacterized protein LY89DRAFT_432742 [Mollisia scopiformis]|uniref:Uncharacterized protein n=1 Tax=Mollisia scopiformis TaxID=149040 RepID=A0A194XMK5_MOLSC|nr:uncharacterized protein LY89DRAFT_432742 [Mollisia scopiformis]KUJ21393.1 hypothetical protein LY89DRAFT_432742 [Mollisia scopiformis]
MVLTANPHKYQQQMPPLACIQITTLSNNLEDLRFPHPAQSPNQRHSKIVDVNINQQVDDDRQTPSCRHNPTGRCDNATSRNTSFKHSTKPFRQSSSGYPKIHRQDFVRVIQRAILRMRWTGSMRRKRSFPSRVKLPTSGMCVRTSRSKDLVWRSRVFKRRSLDMVIVVCDLGAHRDIKVTKRRWYGSQCSEGVIRCWGSVRDMV